MVNLDCALELERTSDEEACSVRVLLELVHDLLICGFLCAVPCRRALDNVCGECVEVDE